MNIQRPDDWRHDEGVYQCSRDGIVPSAVYFHIPFCRHRCGYCDFTLVADRDDLIDDWLRALANELRLMPGTTEVHSIFVGGGTPTHLRPGQLEQFLQLVASTFRLTPKGEYTFEANPDGLTHDKVAILSSFGVNRLSLGVQSFDRDVLQRLERTHSPDDARDTVVRVAGAIPNVSIDLIFGVPGQSPDSWRTTVMEATKLPVKHVSTYGLTFEKGTSFYQRRARGELISAPSEVEREQYRAAMQILNDVGLIQYEISNFARDGFRCAHNQVYWNAQEYFAFGPGAARYLGGVRSTNGRNVSRWVESWLNGQPLLQDWEQLATEDRAREAIMLGLRQNVGIQLDRFERRFDVSVIDLAPTAFTRHLDARLLETASSAEGKQFLRLTNEGRFLADTVITDFL